MTNSRIVTEKDFRKDEFINANPEDYEFSDDGRIVRKDRWEMGIRRIAHLLDMGNAWDITDVIQRVDDFINEPTEYIPQEATAGVSFPKKETAGVYLWGVSHPKEETAGVSHPKEETAGVSLLTEEDIKNLADGKRRMLSFDIVTRKKETELVRGIFPDAVVECSWEFDSETLEPTTYYTIRVLNGSDND